MTEVAVRRSWPVGRFRQAADRGPPGRSRRARVAIALLSVGASLALIAELSPSFAHPGGGMSPPHARLSVDGQVVTIEWTAPPDDAANVGEAIGVFPPGTMEAFLTGPDEALPTDEGVRQLAESPELEAYLLEHVQVRQDGAPCSGEVDVAPDFLEDGAELRFHCPRQVTQVDVRVTVLQDQDPRYETFGVDGTVWTVLFTSEEPEHRWDATAAADGDSIAGALYVAAAALVLLVLGWLLMARRVRRVRRRPRTYGPGGVRRQARGTRHRSRRTTSPSA